MNLFSILRSILLNDLGWKIFSVVLAAVIWFTVHQNLPEAKAVPAHTGSPATNSLPTAYN